jgi:hypothetical protein
MQLSGFLFLLIIITLIVCDILFGHGTIDNLKSAAPMKRMARLTGNTVSVINTDCTFSLI